MLAERPVPDDLDARIRGLRDSWGDDPDVAAVYLFGSRAAGTAGPRSDVDLGVVLRDGVDAAARWRKRLDLLADATRRLGTDAVGVVVLEDAPTVLGHRILRGGKLLCEPQPRRRVVVAEGILRRYLDEAHLRETLDAASPGGSARAVLPVDPVVVRRLLRAIERSLHVLRSLRARGRDAFESDEVVQDRADRHAQLLAQACADVALHILAASGGAAPETYAEAPSGSGTSSSTATSTSTTGACSTSSTGSRTLQSSLP